MAFEDGTILEIKNSHFKDFADTSKYPFEKKISYELSDSSLTAKQTKALIERANDLYCKIRELFFQKELSENDKAVINEYKSVIDRITPPSWIPFYNALNPSYFLWLNSDKTFNELVIDSSGKIKGFPGFDLSGAYRLLS